MVSLVHFALSNILVVSTLGALLVIVPIIGIMIVNDPDTFDKNKPS